MLKTLFFLLSILNVQAEEHSPKIHPDLSTVLAKGDKVNVIVSFKNGIKSTLERASYLRHTHTQRGPRNEALLKMLAENADLSQAGVLNLISTQHSVLSEGADRPFKYYKQYKSSNLLFLKEANPDFINLVAKDDQVSKIEKEPIFVNDLEIDVENQDAETLAKEPSWNVKKIQAPEAWEELGGLKGDGVIVGLIDSGARITHEALRDNFFGTEYGWFDALQGRLEPYDSDYRGHGTAVTSVLAGSLGIGVAPGVQWKMCVSCNNTLCPGEGYFDCIEWMECPALPDGSKPDCSKAPHIVSNSWASTRGETAFNEFILRWREMGIIPVFGIGNNGPACDSSCAPGDQPFVIGVGGTDRNDQNFPYSSIGPAPDGRMQPDISAPGEKVRCAVSVIDSGYTYADGTSLATPHVSGVVALLMARNLDMTYEEVYDILTLNTDQNCTIKMVDWASPCETQNAKVFPNNIFGFGRVNALKAVTAQTAILNAKNGK